MRRDRWTQVLLAAALVLIAFGLFMPRAWYDAVPQNPDLPPPPIKGVTLVQIMFVLEGVALLLLLRRRWSFEPIPQEQRLVAGRDPDQAEHLSRRAATVGLAAITIVALGLRLFRVGSDLWLDEIETTVRYASMSTLGILTSYFGSNNHILNSLLLRWSVTLFGHQEWAIRLPAVLFGTAAIPGLYWVARLALSRTAALGSALLLAVTYHHIFFSQNARGYSAYLFFALVSSGCLCVALRRDTLRSWILYAATLFLGFASLMNTLFVAGAHVLVLAAVVWTIRRRGVMPWALVRRLAAVYLVTGVLTLQLYALSLPHAYLYVKTVYAEPSVGYSLLSREFLAELVRGLAAAASSVGWIALPVLVVAAAIGALGLVRLVRANWVLAGALVLPSLLTAAFLVAKGLAATPRFFLIGMFPAILAGVAAVEALCERWLPRVRYPALPARVTAAALLATAVVALVPLRHYYRTPKQPYRASLDFVRSERKPGEVVIAVHLTEVGYRYYGPRFGLGDGQVYFVRSEEKFNQVVAAHSPDRVLLVTTLHRILRSAHPALSARIEEGWQVVKKFPATIGDGDLAVWRAR